MANIGEKIDAIRRERGVSVLELSKRVDVSLSAVQRQLKTGHMRVDDLFAYARGLGFSIGELLDPELDVSEFTVKDALGYKYPWNLIADVAGIDQDDTEALYEFYIPDVMRSIACLSERTQQVLDLRYRQVLTLREVGRRVGLTQERIRQIIAKAVRILRARHMKRWRVDWIKTRCAYAEHRVEELEEENKTLCADLQKVAINSDKVNDPEFVECYRSSLLSLKQYTDKVLDARIDELDLSVRSYNCLKRDGINTLRDLSRRTYDELRGLRNLGRRSAQEIVTKMHELGVNLKDEQPDETDTVG